MRLINEFKKIECVLARKKGQDLALLDKLTTAYQFFINLMAYYPEKTVHQVGMLTFLQLSDCLYYSGKIRIDRALIELRDNSYKRIVDRVII